MKKFVTLFPRAKNVHLLKDVGMIPYMMYKYQKYDSELVCYNNDDYTYLNNEVKGLKINFINKYFKSDIINGSIFLIKNSKQIDILNIFHCDFKSIIWIFIYKIFNNKGNIYLKLDANNDIKKIKNRNIKNYIKKLALKKCKLVSIELKELYDFLSLNTELNIKYISNGCYRKTINNELKYSDKDNVICTVGRIGTKVKATEVLLEAFALVESDIKEWKLRIIGPIESNFYEYIDSYFFRYPHLKNRIQIIGNITDRALLESEYDKAKIFALTSLWESFGIVIAEAMASGCYIISSDIAAARQITNEGEFGSYFKVGDFKELSKIMAYICNNDKFIDSKFEEIKMYSKKYTSWESITSKINNYLNLD